MTESRIFERQKSNHLNTVTLDSTTYKEISDYAQQNNVSVADILKRNMHEFLEYLRAKKVSKISPTELDFLNAFKGSEWENDKTSAKVVAEYRSQSYSNPENQLTW